MFFGWVKLSVPERCYMLHVRCIVKVRGQIF